MSKKCDLSPFLKEVMKGAVQMWSDQEFHIVGSLNIKLWSSL